MPSATTSDYLHQKMMDHILKSDDTWTPAATVYVALFTTVASLDGSGGVEVSGGSYARQAISCSATESANGWNGPSNGEYTNKNDITFAVPTANWGTILGAGLYDALSAGNLLYVCNLTTPKTVNNGDGAPKILSGQLRISRATCP